MTREQAIKALKWFKEYNEEDYCGGDRIQDEHGDWYYRITEQDFEAFDVAIKALEQEPFINKPCVSSGVCEHDKNNVLDKIRAEILEEMLSHSGTGEEVIQAYADGLKKGLEFIDKYKAEVRDKG